MITQCKQRMQVMCFLGDFDYFVLFMHLFRSKKILKASLHPKLKGASFWPFNTHNKVATG